MSESTGRKRRAGDAHPDAFALCCKGNASALKMKNRRLGRRLLQFPVSRGVQGLQYEQDPRNDRKVWQSPLAPQVLAAALSASAPHR